MKYERTKGTHKYAFDSLHDLGEYAHKEPRTWAFKSSEMEEAEESWDLGAGYAAAVDMARNGWLEGAERAQEALKAFTPATPTPDTKVDFYGFRPHVPRFCAGAPDSMIRHARDAESGFRPVLTLGVPVNALAYAKAQCMANFGIAVAQYVNQLETQGTRVELIGMSVSNVNGQRVAHSWVIKHADQPLDLAVVAFSIGHPAMFRRLGFALLERCHAPGSSSYGQTAEAFTSDLINPAPGTFILNGMKQANECAKTPEAALEYVTKQIDTAIAQQEL